MLPWDCIEASHCSSGIDLMWRSYFTHGIRNRMNIKALRLLGCGGPTLPERAVWLQPDNTPDPTQN